MSPDGIPAITSGVKRLWRLGGPWLILGRALRHVSDELVALSAPAAFRIQTARIADIEAAIDLAVGIQFRHYETEIRAVQKRGEIAALLSELRELEPRRLVEIGTWKGGTLFLLTRVATADATLVSVDVPGNGFNGGYPARLGRLYRAFARDHQTIHLIRRNSHERATVEEVSRTLRGPVDFLFIDGDHSYDGVKRDFDDYVPLVRGGGIVALHDIVPGDGSLVGGVPRFWSEIKTRYDDVEEYVQDWSQGGCGIGVIRLPR